MEIGKELAKALLGFQSEAIDIKKSADNPFFHSKYAPLDEIIPAIRAAIKKHGLVYMQVPTAEDTLVTIVCHVETGQSISGSIKLKPKDNSPQAQGSAITYARRYALVSMLGLNTEGDDDGNAASSPSKPSQPRPAVQAPIQQTVNPTPPKPAYATTQRPPSAPPKPGCITSPQTARLHAIAKSNGKTYAELKEYIKIFGIQSTSDMKRENYDAAIAWAEGKPVLVDESPIDDEQAF